MTGIGRRQFIAALGGAAAWPLAVRGQTGRLPKVGFLYPGIRAMTETRIAAVREGMRAVNYADADTVEFVVRASDGDPSKLPALAAGLVESTVDLILAASPSAVRAIKAATSSIPVVAHDLCAEALRAAQRSQACLNPRASLIFAIGVQHVEAPAAASSSTS